MSEPELIASSRRGGDSPGLDELLFERPYRFDFFQAVRLLSRIAPDRQAVGGDALPTDEVARFRALLALDFPASSIQNLDRPRRDGLPPTLTQAFLGLYGPSGALPRHYTELLLTRVHHSNPLRRDLALREFLDIFNHRLVSLFYRAWEKYRPWLTFEEAEAGAEKAAREGGAHLRSYTLERRPRVDIFGQTLLDLAGTGAPALRYQASERESLAPRREVADETTRYYVGLLAQRRRSAIGLESLLQDYFELPLKVAQFQGQWLTLPPEHQARMGRDTAPPRLGVDTVIGERIWERQGKFRVRVGPLRYREFVEFLPSGKAYRPMAHLTRLYVGQQFDFDLQLVLRAAEVPSCRLAGQGSLGGRLGWDTWVASRDFEEDVADAVLQVQDG